MDPLSQNAITRIALYQVVALVYGVLASAVATNLFRDAASECHLDPTGYGVYLFAHEYCEFGGLLFLAIIGWTVAASQLLTEQNGNRITPEFLWGSGIGFALLLGVLPTLWAMGLAMGPEAGTILTSNV